LPSSESGDPNSAKAKLTKLQSLGPNAIKPIVDAPDIDKRETVAFVETLTPLIDNKSFPLVAQALEENRARSRARPGVAHPETIRRAPDRPPANPPSRSLPFSTSSRRRRTASTCASC
jgi:hypothetical protein